MKVFWRKRKSIIYSKVVLQQRVSLSSQSQTEPSKEMVISQKLPGQNNSIDVFSSNRHSNHYDFWQCLTKAEPHYI